MLDIELLKMKVADMTLRDYFAAQAMAGLLSNSKFDPVTNRNQFVVVAYGIADAMLVARGLESGE